MPRQKTAAYRPTPTNPNTVEPRPASSAIEDLDDFLDEVDGVLIEEEAFAANYRQRGGE